jgi:hypothetical protein
MVTCYLILPSFRLGPIDRPITKVEMLQLHFPRALQATSYFQMSSKIQDALLIAKMDIGMNIRTTCMRISNLKTIEKNLEDEFKAQVRACLNM